MRRIRAIAFAAAIFAVAGPARPAVPLSSALLVLGSVTNAAHPVGDALIIAFNLASFDVVQTFSGTDGAFALPPLPAGIYKVIAVKQGYVPAIEMVAPPKKDHRLALRLESTKKAGPRDVNQEIWEIRASLPPEILRELDMAMAPPAMNPKSPSPRFRGEMVSMTAVTDPAVAPALSQTAVGLQSRIGDSWQIGIRGNIHRVDDQTDDLKTGPPAAQSTGMVMEIRSSPTDSYKVASTKSFWRYRDDGSNPEHQADIQSHNFEWQHGDSRVQVRYFAQQNLFESNPAGSDLIEISGNTPLLQTRRGELGVSMRVAQESIHNISNGIIRTADVTANGTFDLIPAFALRYGLSSRVGLDGAEWAPRTGAEWRLSRGTSIVVTGLYKILDQARPVGTLPSIVAFSDDSRILPRYSYSFGVVSGRDELNRFTATATVSALDSAMRVVFNDGFEQFWDGLFVQAGDIRRDVRLDWRHQLNDRFTVDLSASAGTASQYRAQLQGSARKSYAMGDLQSSYRPTGTSVEVSFREIRQPQSTGRGPNYRADRMNVRMAQSLHLPLDLKLLLGIELVRAENSPLVLDPLDPEALAKKYMGGLAVNF
ncbi:MAG TPA: carboxypeptidase-like regulatory domain-containing protein [Thermoanaerobaculia bacterium]|nr:carboxypeptidase-like regulatory domain-containing protein [Thermoanaerobaculia bacterium]